MHLCIHLYVCLQETLGDRYDLQGEGQVTDEGSLLITAGSVQSIYVVILRCPPPLLPRLLLPRSLIEFFNKMKKWQDMASLPQDFRQSTDKLERNFTVSAVIFKKYVPIFKAIFKAPSEEPPRVHRSRKQRWDIVTFDLT